LLLLDEPAGGLDPAARREFLETSIQALNRDGTTILFSSHHMPDVERIGERVILLHENKVELDASLDRIRERTCIAIVPRTLVSDPSSLSRLPGILRVRAFLNDFHVVVEGEPDEAHSRMKAALGQNGIRCVQVPLEELFIEMVGAERKETS
jgi:ABC-2 type transport system ATP-binding protein